MIRSLGRRAYAVIALLALAIANAGPFASSPAEAGAVATPSGPAFMETPPPLTATATPQPSGQIVKYAGQLLDYRDGFAFFTTGDAYRVDPNVKIDDAATGGPTSLVPETRVYARAGFDTGNGGIVELSLSQKKLPDDASYQDIKKFAVALSTPYANPDLVAGEGFSGADDYYDRASSSHWAPQIAVPALILHALDDPFIRMLPSTRAALLANHRVRLVETAHGGHCAFLASADEYDGYWAEKMLLDFLLSVTKPRWKRIGPFRWRQPIR